jgi:hypothetical protein
VLPATFSKGSLMISARSAISKDTCKACSTHGRYAFSVFAAANHRHRLTVLLPIR